MKIVAFNGSPHTEKGTTHVMVQEFLQGAQDAGAEVEIIFLAQQKIQHCLGCMNCWVKTPGKCIFKDDMPELLSKYLAADVAVFATPLYIDNVSGMMKTFMDRLFMPIEDSHWEKEKDAQYGEVLHVRRYDTLPKLVTISPSGHPEQGHFQVLRLLFRRMARNFKFELAAEIYRGGGSGLLNGGIGFEPFAEFAEQYKQLLRQAGREFAEQSKLSEETKVKLEQPVLPGDDYVDRYIQIMESTFDGYVAAMKSR